MDTNQSVIYLVIEAARERCEALSRQLDKAAEKQYPSNGPHNLIKIIKQINQTVDLKLLSLGENEEIFSLLTPQQIHLHINRYSQLIPYLHNLLGFLDGAELKDTPSPFVPFLRQLVEEHLSNTELLLASKSELNYTYFEISKRIKDLLSEADLNENVDLPDNFLVITFPKVEAGNILLHCVIAHEIGHGLYQRNAVEQKLLSLIKIDKDKITQLASKIYKSETEGLDSSRQPLLFPNENEINANITVFVNNTIKSWLEELASDAIALILFGPAYFFATVHLLISFQLIESHSESHPPNSIRLRLMLLMLGALGESDASLNLRDDLPEELITFIENWKTMVERSELKNPLYEVPMESTLAILDSIGKIAREIVGDKRYPSGQNGIVEKLCELIVNSVPPNELVDFDSQTFIYPGMIKILNAGWQVLIAHIDEYAKFFGREYSDDRAFIKGELNKLILKAVELENIRIRLKT